VITKPLSLNAWAMDAHIEIAFSRVADGVMPAVIELWELASESDGGDDTCAVFMKKFMDLTKEVVDIAQSSLIYDVLDEEDRTAMLHEAEEFRTLGNELRTISDES
jgi:hypothetical protein